MWGRYQIIYRTCSWHDCQLLTHFDSAATVVSNIAEMFYFISICSAKTLQFAHLTPHQLGVIALMLTGSWQFSKWFFKSSWFSETWQVKQSMGHNVKKKNTVYWCQSTNTKKFLLVPHFQWQHAWILKVHFPHRPTELLFSWNQTFSRPQPCDKHYTLYLFASGELKLIKVFPHFPSNVEWCSISLALQDLLVLNELLKTELKLISIICCQLQQ